MTAINLSQIEPSQKNADELFPPSDIGPVWQKDTFGQWLMPEYTIGWDVITWAEMNLSSPMGDGTKLRITPEQMRIILWHYAVTEDGNWAYWKSLWQSSKGSGKDGLGAILGIVELIGPCRFSHWEYHEDGTKSPVSRDNPAALVQFAGVSKAQTNNTMDFIPLILNERVRGEYNLEVQKEIVYATGTGRKLEQVGSNHAALQGNRATYVVMNEALALDTPIPGPSGWKLMGELVDGDVIYGRDGQPVTVTKAHEVQYGRKAYKVNFKDGTSITASDGHLWTARRSSGQKAQVVTTEHMYRDMATQTTRHPIKWRLPRAGAQERPVADLPVDPYLVGYWLGDGSTGDCNITVGLEDAEAFEAEMSRIDAKVHQLKVAPGRARRYGFSGRSGFGSDMGNDLSRVFRRLACFKDKHVPKEYMEGSIEQRTAVVQGLMDSDGCATKQGFNIFVGTKRLAEDMMELLRGLGQGPYLSFAPDDRSREGGCYRVTFTARDGFAPYRFERKAARVKQAKGGYEIIDSIQEVESVPVRCISVDADDRLFQAGIAPKVTHNTQHWIPSQGGPKLYDVLKNNVLKTRGHFLMITNAHEPGEDSMLERIRLDQEKVWAGLAKPSGWLYMSREAHPKAPLHPDWAGFILKRIYGDATWQTSDLTTLSAEVLDGSTPTSQIRRMFYNMIVASEDALFDRAEWTGAAVEGCFGDRRDLRQGDEIVLGFDGGKTDDATALVAIRIRDKMIVPLVIEQKPDGPLGETWQVNELLIDEEVHRAFQEYKVRAFFADPALWQSWIASWSEEYRELLQVKPSSDSSIAWDMSGNHRKVAQMWELYYDAIKSGQLRHNGDKTLAVHALNAKRGRNRSGLIARKENPESPRKIDAMVASYVAYAALRAYLERGKRTTTYRRTMLRDG